MSPWFDLLFIVNLWWLVAFLPGWVDSSGGATFEFWQLYFITTPHRWLTLLLVSTDPDRVQGRSSLFIGIAIGAAVLVGGLYSITGALSCAALIDYLWNAWHFGSQHGGIVRIYARKGGGGRPLVESNILRLFVAYTAIRLTGWATGWTEQFPVAVTTVRILDLVVLALPVTLLAFELLDTPRARLGKVLYLASVTGLYGALILAVRATTTLTASANVAFYQRTIVGLTIASAAFHAIEYFAIVTYYAQRRCDNGSDSLFRSIARRWFQLLAFYLVLLGLFSQYIDRVHHEFWLALNLWCAYLHYAYDGMIWKFRRPETAKTMGVELKPQ